MIRGEIHHPFQSRREAIRAAVIIFTVALAARILFLIARGPSLIGDGPDYLILAKNLVTQGVYSLDVLPPFIPSIRRAPLYPFLLAGISLVTGKGGESPVLLITIIQATLDSLVAVMVCVLARFSVSTKLAIGTGIFYALNPGNIAMSRSILTETVFTTLLVSTVLMIAFGVLRRQMIFTCIAGVFLGLAILCRPLAFPLVFVFPSLALLVSGLPRKWIHAAAIIGITCVVAMPWLIRCRLVSGSFVMVQSASAINFYAPTLLDVNQSNEDLIWPRIFSKSTVDPYGYYLVRATTPAEMIEADHIGFRQVRKNILANPRGYISSRITAYPHLFLSSFDSFTGINQSFSVLVAQKDWFRLLIKFSLFSVFSALSFTLALVGLLKARSNIVIALCSAMWVYTLIIHLPMWIEYRFWLPVVPFLAVSASAGASLILQRARAMQYTEKFRAALQDSSQTNA